MALRGRTMDVLQPSHIESENRFALLATKFSLNPPIRNHPHTGHRKDEQTGNNWQSEQGQRNGEHIGCKRNFALAVVADGLGDQGLLAMRVDDLKHQNGVGHSAHAQVECVHRHGHCGEVVFSHPGGGEWHERQPEKQVQISHKDAAVHMLSSVQQVVVIGPIDAHIREAQHVA